MERSKNEDIYIFHERHDFIYDLNIFKKLYIFSFPQLCPYFWKLVEVLLKLFTYLVTKRRRGECYLQLWMTRK